MSLLEPATDWTGHSQEIRAEECARFLATHGFITPVEARRIMNGVRCSADAQRTLNARKLV